MELKAKLLLEKDDRTGKRRLRIEGNPAVLAVGLVVLGVLAYGVGVTVHRVVISYGAYEGTVLGMEPDWFSSWFGDETHPTTRLAIRTPDGREITRFAGDYSLSMNRITIGDYIQKDSGFFKAPVARKKKSFPQMLDEMKKKHPAAFE